MDMTYLLLYECTPTGHVLRMRNAYRLYLCWYPPLPLVGQVSVITILYCACVQAVPVLISSTPSGRPGLCYYYPLLCSVHAYQLYLCWYPPLPLVGQVQVIAVIQLLHAGEELCGGHPAHHGGDPVHHGQPVLGSRHLQVGQRPPFLYTSQDSQPFKFTRRYKRIIVCYWKTAKPVSV